MIASESECAVRFVLLQIPFQAL